MIIACFARVRQRCTGRIYMGFLFILQEVSPIGKTCNQLRDNRWLSTSGDVPIRVVILCSVYAVPWVSWCDAVERRGTVLVVWIFFTSTIACLGVISTPDRSRSTHFEIVSGNACFGQLSTEMFSFITSSASCSRSRRTSGRNQPSTKDLGGIDESIDLSRDR